MDNSSEKQEFDYTAWYRISPELPKAMTHGEWRDGVYSCINKVFKVKPYGFELYLLPFSLTNFRRKGTQTIAKAWLIRVDGLSPVPTEEEVEIYQMLGYEVIYTQDSTGKNQEQAI